MGLSNGDANEEIHEVLNSRCFGGRQKAFHHYSTSNQCRMHFSVFLPPQFETVEKLPIIYWLSGYNCDHMTVAERTGMQRLAAKYGVIVLSPDTSPRPSDVTDLDLKGIESLSFYIDATESQFKKHIQMFSYVTKEIPEIAKKHFKADLDRQSIMGHSMGGHGALITFLRCPGQYRCASALAPPCHPVAAKTSKLYEKYLGVDKDAWKKYDASELVKTYKGPRIPILVDQGKEDRYYADGTMNPEALQKSCEESNYPLLLNLHDNYGHSFYFVNTFFESHFEYHMKYLDLCNNEKA